MRSSLLQAFGADELNAFAAIRHLASYYSAILSSGSSTGPSAKRQKTSSSSRPALSAADIASAPLILLTDDAANLSLALADGLVALTAKDFVSSLPSAQQESLVDLLAVSGSGLDRDAAGAGRRKCAALYAEHLPTSVLQAGVKAGKFVQGHFNPSQYNFREVCDAFAFMPNRD